MSPGNAVEDVEPSQDGADEDQDGEPEQGAGDVGFVAADGWRGHPAGATFQLDGREKQGIDA